VFDRGQIRATGYEACTIPGPNVRWGDAQKPHLTISAEQVIVTLAKQASKLALAVTSQLVVHWNPAPYTLVPVKEWL